MKRLMMMVLTLALLCTAAFAEGGMPNAVITVQGDAAVTAVPDIVVVTANASAMSDTMLGAQREISGVVSETTAALMSLGILAEDIVTTNYFYYTQYEYSGETPGITGYQAQHTLDITCRDPQMLDSVITAVTAGGMTEIYNVSYDLSNRAELYNQALELAISAAESKAIRMAQAGGKTITGLSRLEENRSYDARYARVSAADGGEADTIRTGIRSGSVSVSASVTAEYAAQ